MVLLQGPPIKNRQMVYRTFFTGSSEKLGVWVGPPLKNPSYEYMETT